MTDPWCREINFPTRTLELESCEDMFQLIPFISDLAITSVLYFNILLIIQTYPIFGCTFFLYELLEVLKGY